MQKKQEWNFALRSPLNADLSCILRSNCSFNNIVMVPVINSTNRLYLTCPLFLHPYFKKNRYFEKQSSRDVFKHSCFKKTNTFLIKCPSAGLAKNIAKFSKTLLYVERLWTANNVFHFWSVVKLLVWRIHFNFQQIDWTVSQSSCLMWQQNSTTVKYSSVFSSVNKILLFQTKFHEKVLPIFMLLRYIKIQATFQQILSFLFFSFFFSFPKEGDYSSNVWNKQDK